MKLSQRLAKAPSPPRVRRKPTPKFKAEWIERHALMLLPWALALLLGSAVYSHVARVAHSLVTTITSF